MLRQTACELRRSLATSGFGGQASALHIKRGFSSTLGNSSNNNTIERNFNHTLSPVNVESERERQVKEIVDSMLRVNHAGEFGAKRIYQGQLDALRGDPSEPLIQHMQAQEQVHLDTFDEMLVEYRARPTVLQPMWHVFGYSLGYISGMLGKEAAMACTEAVETVIGEHYNDQLRELNEQEISDPKLKEAIRKFRDEELEHLDIAVKNDSHRAKAYEPLVAFVSASTKLAIWLSKRI